ncbi:hypothetical protein RCL_jg27683.t1 [Rhizophagus clarus]|uniref:Uncharacterized protein n=1 Tax=Rhizophagus clarus TaxID=94130 RepID=A0A8H3KWX1_9GLOM|nr:hypothetical protein RCL_jg27683.t1 [Rhizophagus clarus]
MKISERNRLFENFEFLLKNNGKVRKFFLQTDLRPEIKAREQNCDTIKKNITYASFLNNKIGLDKMDKIQVHGIESTTRVH